MNNHTEQATVRMANDIAAAFQHRPWEEATRSVARHITLFWDPRMRTALLAHVDAGGIGLDPLSLDAATLLRR